MASVPPATEALLEQYRVAFDDQPMLMGVDLTVPEVNAIMVSLLEDALEEDEPIADADLWAALGMEPPPADAWI